MSLVINPKYEKLVKRYESVMDCIGREHMKISKENSEPYAMAAHYGTENGIDVKWMRDDVHYWLSCYYDRGNCRSDPEYRSEKGRLQRLMKAINELPQDDWIIRIEKE